MKVGFLKPILSKFHSYFGNNLKMRVNILTLPSPLPAPGWGERPGRQKKDPKPQFWVKNFFPLILPKKHSLITQKRFWPFFRCLVWLFRVPQNYIFWWFKWKNGRKSRDPARRLVFFSSVGLWILASVASIMGS